MVLGGSRDGSSGFAAISSITEPPPGPPKAPGKLVRVENFSRATSGGVSNQAQGL